MPCHRDPPPRELLERVREQVGAVLVVDDGSPDPAAVARVAEAVGAEVFRLPTNRGKGHALVAGISHLLARDPAPTAIVTIDSDGQHPPELVPAFIEAGGRADLVVGDRIARASRMPPERRVANALARGLLALATRRRRVGDTQCGMRLLRGRALHDVRFPPGGYEAETVHLKRCLQAGVAVEWVPMPAVYADERSSFRNVRDTVRVLRALLR